MYKCKICGKVFSRRISLERHVTSSYGKEKQRKHCPILVYKCKYEGDKRFSKRSLDKMYIVDKKSTPMMKEILKVNKKTLLDTMRFYGIKLRNISEAAKNQIERDGLWNKGLTKRDHPSIMSYAKRRIGKNNPYYTAPNFKERQKRNILILKKARKQSNNNRNPASTEKRMARILDDQELHYIRNFSLNFYENGKTKWRLYDFLVEGKLLIEMQGNYFHANPRMYDKDYMVVIARAKKKTSDIWEYDDHKLKLAQSNGYETLVLWEDDFVGMGDKEIIDMVRGEI